MESIIEVKNIAKQYFGEDIDAQVKERIQKSIDELLKLGAEIIELHITSNKNINFIDNYVSFDYKELDYLIKQLKLIEKIKR